jgi:predicted house-cleaning noncanonical NTP pyrophosphatase (MazG superfamily)
MEVQQKPFEVLETELEKYYDIRGREEVREFIEARPYLEAPLLEIPGKIKEYFGVEKKFGLFVAYDVEIPSDSCLDVDIRIGSDSEEKFAIENKLSEDWWYDVSMSIRHQIVLSRY